MQPGHRDTLLVPGLVFAGRYKIEALVGVGGMGAVYAAFDDVVGERVALKTLSSVSGDERAIERFRREVRLARRITHRNVARTFDLGVHEGVHFLTMEYLEGKSLRDLVRERGRLSAREALDIGAQMADGLGAAHDAGVVHRDLKLSNVLVDAAGRVVILDFGIARSLLPGEAKSATLAGTPVYMAPEQLEERPLDARTDLYSLGIVLHELLAGRMPDWGARQGVLARLEVERPRLALPEGSPELVLLLNRLLSRDPEARPRSAREVSALLRAASSDEPTAQGALPEAPTVVDTHRLQGGPFAPLPERGNVLAVFPFAERGDQPGLGGPLAEAVVDVLSRTRGLRVLAPSATARTAPDANPLQVGGALGAGLFVEGTVQRRGDDVRVTARLVEVATGVQLWSERFELPFSEVFELEDQLGQRIAEALRVELAIVKDRGSAPPQAIELLLAARREIAELGPAVELFTHALELAPDFRPAIAGRSLAHARRLFTALASGEPDSQAEAAVAEGLRRAGDFPESHLAAAMLASNRGQYFATARHLRTALAIAPTSAEAQDYLGHLQLDAGREDEGMRRVKIAMALDPTAPLPPANLARHHLFHGRAAAYESARRELERRTNGQGPIWLQLVIRAAAWAGERETLARILAENAGEQRPAVRMVLAYAKIAREPERDPAEFVESHAPLFASARFRTFVEQLAAEAWGLRKQPEQALARVRAAADLALIDVVWLEHCPALAGARSLPGFAEVVEGVRDRARAIWID